MRPTKTLLALPFAAVLAACPGKDKPPAPVVKIDTTPAKLDSLVAAIPKAVPDTFTPVKITKPRPQPAIPKAPPPLQAVVEHEQAFSRFCYQEFGQKTDPKLQGGVALVVTVGGAGGITNVRVGDDNWTSKAGEEVNKCLLPRAKEAWRLTPGSVKPGDYVVQLQFRGS
ncbi:MAG: hypothetical protein M3081_07225 [Gemmatimonadota bacterium]|nr:hypothetical protein [Gemmatimonadota bacterium]